MVDFKFPSKEFGWIAGVRGTVTNTNKWSETYVSSSGGGGYVGPRGGHVSAPRVTSTVIERGEFWLRTPQGKEVQFKEHIPVAPGHEVIVLWGNSKENGDGANMYWRNFTSQRHSIIENSVKDHLIYTSEELKLSRFALLIPWMLLILLAFYSGQYASFWIPTAIVLGWLPGALIAASLFEFGAVRKKRLQDLLDHLGTLTDREKLAFES